MAYKNILDTSFYDGRYQGSDGLWHYVPIDWSLAKAKWAGAIVKEGEGTAQDPLYTKQIAAMKLNNVPYGSYNIFRAETNAIIAANKFCDVAEFNGGYGSLGVWLDVELKPATMSATTYFTRMGSWLYEAEKRIPSNITVGIYSRNSFWEPLWVEAGRPSWTRPYVQWNARYVSTDFYTNYHDEVLAGTRLPVPFPLPMLGLGEMIGVQWTEKGRPGEIPGYPPYKLSVDFDLWDERAFEAVPPVILTLEERVALLETRYTDLDRRVTTLENN